MIPVPPGVYDCNVVGTSRVPEGELFAWRWTRVRTTVVAGAVAEVAAIALPASYVQITLQLDPPPAPSRKGIEAMIVWEHGNGVDGDAWTHSTHFEPDPWPRALRPGAWTLRARTEGYEEHVQEVVLAPGVVTQVKLELVKE